MKRSTALLAVITIFIANSMSIAEDVNFPDANLEAKVRSELHIPAPETITDTDMQTIRRFMGADSSISNIDGLEYATGIAWLYLYENQISDISPLSPLTQMRHLYLHDNHISNISALSGMSELTWLGLNKNQISNISPVSNLESIEQLDLKYNQISDISPVSDLKNLEQLDLDYNHISDISAISGLKNLDKLGLGNNQISDISPLSSLTNIRIIYIAHNRISDTSGLTGLSNLKYVSLKDNDIETLDLTASELVSLTNFEISDNPVKTVILKDATLNQNKTFYALMYGGGSGNTGIAEMGGVLRLDMSGVDFDGISYLFYVMHGMDDLEELLLADAINLDGSQLSQLTGELDSLNYLDVTGTWDTFNLETQDSLGSWDALDGNTLITPEPATLMLLGLGGLVLRRRRG